MRFNKLNHWYHSSEFLRACAAVHAARGTLSFMDAHLFRAKYIQIYVDQRSGDFILRDGHGVKLTHEEVYAMFPSLKDE